LQQVSRNSMKTEVEMGYSFQAMEYISFCLG
jgi:hypothetical protein